MPERNSAIFRQRALKLARIVRPILFDLDIEGAENLVNQGPLLVLFNHLGHPDGPIIFSIYERPLEFIALHELNSKPVIGHFMRRYGATTVRREGYDRQALESVLPILEAGAILAMAPEGRISVSGALEAARTGAAYLALRSGTPIQPIAIWGTGNTNKSWRRLQRAEVGVRIGKVMKVDKIPDGKRVDREARRTLTNELMYTIAGMLPPKYRGVYAELTESSLPSS